MSILHFVSTSPRAALRSLAALAAAALLATLAGCPAPAVDPKSPGTLRAAAAQRPLDEPVGVSTAGYTQDAFLSGPFPSDEPGSPFSDIFPSTRGIETQPMAKVVALDNGRTQLVIARIDAVFVTAVLTERVLALVQAQSHVDLRGKLILDATHTHAEGCRFSRESLSPQALSQQPPLAQHALAHGCDTFSQEMVERIAGPIAGAIGDALAALKPARFGYASGLDTTAAYDRRCDNDWITGGKDQDTRVTVLRVEGTDGAPIAALFHYAMHGTVSGSANRSLNTDAPGHAELAVERNFNTPVVAMYLQGNAGDASPDGKGDSGTQSMQREGADLAATVAQLWTQAGQSMQESLVLQSLEREVQTHHDQIGYASGEFFEDGAVLCQFTYTPPCPGAPIPPDQVLCIGPAIEGEGKYQSRVVAARIGNLALVTLPGEPTAAVGRALRQQILTDGYGITDALVLGYAQDHDGYLLFDSDWLSGGYEPTISFWGWKYAAFIVGQSADALHELLTGTALQKILPEPAPVDGTPLPYTKVAPVPSSAAPSVSVQPAAQVERLQPVRASFLAGDPALGNPEVRLQVSQSGTFTDVMINGWIPASSVRGEIPLVYTATPNYKTAPTATSRQHQWDAVYEPPVDLPAGTYRFHLTGQAVTGAPGSAPVAVDLATTPFTVVPSTQLFFDASLQASAGTLHIALTPRYPEPTATFAPDPNPDWQISGFRLTDPRYTVPFAPVDPGTAALSATLTGPSGAQAISLQPQHPAWPAGPSPFAPGAGPGFTADIAVVSGSYTLALPAGLFADANGNASAAAQLQVSAP